jgi:hypothetical protein
MYISNLDSCYIWWSLCGAYKDSYEARQRQQCNIVSYIILYTMCYYTPYNVPLQFRLTKTLLKNKNKNNRLATYIEVYAEVISKNGISLRICLNYVTNPILLETNCLHMIKCANFVSD